MKNIKKLLWSFHNGNDCYDECSINPGRNAEIGIALVSVIDEWGEKEHSELRVIYDDDSADEIILRKVNKEKTNVD